MNKYTKIFIYVSIPVIIAGAFYFFNKKQDTKLDKSSSNSSLSNAPRQSRSALPVKVFVANSGIINTGIRGIGTLLANETVNVASELSGKIEKINFREGQFVNKGEILVKLNDDDLQAQLARAQYQMKLTQEKLERQKILLEKEAVSREDYDQVQTEYNVLSQDIAQIKIKIDRTEIKAPFSGIIGFRDVSLGAYLQPGVKIATLVDIANLKLEFAIAEKYITNNLIGKTAEFTVEGTSEVFKANIFAMDPQLDTKTRTILLRAMFNNSSNKLRPGMSAKVLFNSSKDGESILIPNQSIVQGAKGRSVWVVKDGKAVSKNVEIGTRTEDMIEIRKGLEQGDSIIISGLMQVRANQKVIAQ